MKLYFTIIMGILAGLLLADKCDHVNHKNPPGWARISGFVSREVFEEEIKNYRKSLCERNSLCRWRERRGEEFCVNERYGQWKWNGIGNENENENGNGNGKVNDEKKKQILEMITKKLVKKISRLLGPLVKNFDLKFNVKKINFFATD